MRQAATGDVIKYLGGPAALKAEVRTDSDLDELSSKGLPYSAVAAVSGKLHLTSKELSSTLRIPQRTLTRRKENGALTPDESDRLIRMTKAVTKAEEVLEDHDSAVSWLRTPNKALGGVTPLSLLGTHTGYERVMDLLIQIDNSVYS